MGDLEGVIVGELGGDHAVFLDGEWEDAITLVVDVLANEIYSA